MWVSPEVLYFCFAAPAAHPGGAAVNPRLRYGASPPKYTGFLSLQQQAWAWRHNRFTPAEQLPIINARNALAASVAVQPAGALAVQRQAASLACIAAGPPATLPHPLEPGDAYHVWGLFAGGGLWQMHRCWSCRTIYLYNPTEVGLGPFGLWNGGDHGNFGCAEPVCHMLCMR
jgi:hypothetical protein